MSTIVRTLDLVSPSLATLLRATRRITLLVASLAVAVTACAPVAATSPLPGPAPIEDEVDTDHASEGMDLDTRCFPGMPEAACVTEGDGADGDLGGPTSGADDHSTRVPVAPAPDCERSGPIVPC